MNLSLKNIFFWELNKCHYSHLLLGTFSFVIVHLSGKRLKPVLDYHFQLCVFLPFSTGWIFQMLFYLTDQIQYEESQT